MRCYKQNQMHMDSKQPLLIIFSYLNNHKQRVKINKNLSSWKYLIQRVSQGYVIGPLLFHMYFIFFLQDVSLWNFVDDTAFFLCDQKLMNLLKSLEERLEIALCWLENNYIKLNTDKCQFLVSHFKYEQTWTKTGSDKNRESA